ncbi:MAG: hypothetical protein RRC07_17475 [Anaerolineae bacterium]|nr:hypothetical protein [Anaerolineae bacterium]
MKRTGSLVFLLLALVLAVACTPGAANDLDPGEDAGEGTGALFGHEALAEGLAAAGLEVAEGDLFSGELSDPLFEEATPRSLNVGEATIQTYEFGSEAEAEAAAATVNPTGTIIGNKTVDWIEPPHFYRQRSLIVLYPGDDEAVLGALEALLGEPFVAGAGGFIQPSE